MVTGGSVVRVQQLNLKASQLILSRFQPCLSIICSNADHADFSPLSFLFFVAVLFHASMKWAFKRILEVRVDFPLIRSFDHQGKRGSASAIAAGDRFHDLD